MDVMTDYYIVPCLTNEDGVRTVMSESVLENTLCFIHLMAWKELPLSLVFCGEEALADASFYEMALPLARKKFGRRLHLSVTASDPAALTENLLEILTRNEAAVILSEKAGQREAAAKNAALLRSRRIAFSRLVSFDEADANAAKQVFEESDQPYSIRCDGLSDEARKQVLLDSFNACLQHPAHTRVGTIDAMARACLYGKADICTHCSNCLEQGYCIDPEGLIYNCPRFVSRRTYSMGQIGDHHRFLDMISDNTFSFDEVKETLESDDACQTLARCRQEKEAACSACPHTAYCKGGCLYDWIMAQEKQENPENGECGSCAYKAVFDAISAALTYEIAAVVLRDADAAEMPVLSMAGKVPHPYDARAARERLIKTAAMGKTDEPLAERLITPYPENGLQTLVLSLNDYDRKSTKLSVTQMTDVIREAIERRFYRIELSGDEPLACNSFDKLCSKLQTIERKGTKLALRSPFRIRPAWMQIYRLTDLFDEIIFVRNVGDDSDEITVRNLKQAYSFNAEKLILAARDDEEKEALYELAEKAGIPRDRVRTETTCARCSTHTDDGMPRFSCGLGRNLFIDANGRVYPCFVYNSRDKGLGNLKKETLGAIIDRGELAAYRHHHVDTNEKCSRCAVRYLCGGICKSCSGNYRDVDSGDFDCTAEKERLEQLVRKAEAEASSESQG